MNPSTRYEHLLVSDPPDEYPPNDGSDNKDWLRSRGISRPVAHPVKLQDRNKRMSMISNVCINSGGIVELQARKNNTADFNSGAIVELHASRQQKMSIISKVQVSSDSM